MHSRLSVTISIMNMYLYESCNSPNHLSQVPRHIGTVEPASGVPMVADSHLITCRFSLQTTLNFNFTTCDSLVT
jgi:hypothetical protein